LTSHSLSVCVYRPYCFVTTTIVGLLLFPISAEGKRINGSLS
jgi:hypothetical protein